MNQLLDEIEHDNINYDSSHERASEQFQQLFVHELYSSGDYFSESSDSFHASWMKVASSSKRGQVLNHSHEYEFNLYVNETL